MATLTLAYDHTRDPMYPADLADRLVAQFNLTTAPTVDINPTQIIITHPNVSSANTAAIQTVINAYVLDPNRVKYGDGTTGTLMARAKQAVDVNNTFLALAAPNNAQTLAQVQRLTRETTALIKLALNEADDLAGT